MALITSWNTGLFVAILSVALIGIPHLAMSQDGKVLSAPDTQAGQSGDVLADIRSIKAAGGTDPWDDAIKPILVGAFDTDKSGAIDSVAEVNAIPCDVLKLLDNAIKPYDKGKSGLTWTYGFKPGDYSWVGSALGFDEKVRSPAFQRMKSCGVRVGA